MRFIAPILVVGALAQTVLAEDAVKALHGATEAAAGAHAEAASPFAGTVYQSVAAIVVFVVVMVILKKAAWGPILTGLQDRENKIKSDLLAAENASKQAQASLEEYRKQLASANDEGRKIIDQAKADAQRVANQLREQAAAEITILKNRAEADIKAAKEQALAEVYEQTAVLATNVAGKILRRQITAEDQQTLVRESLAELGKSGKN